MQRGAKKFDDVNHKGMELVSARPMPDRLGSRPLALTCFSNQATGSGADTSVSRGAVNKPKSATCPEAFSPRRLTAVQRPSAAAAAHGPARV